jgi:triosephosphate isomerase
MPARRPEERRSRPLVAGNWKMNGTRAQAQHLAAIAIETARDVPQVEVAVFPPSVWLEAVAELLRAAQGTVALGGQWCHGEAKGAHTGAVSAPMLAEVGCAYVLAGHSEVRRECGQDDARVRASSAAGLAAGLRVLLCVGEDGPEREAGRAREVVVRQVDAVVAGLSGAEDRLDVAYEPVWAIGTGRHALPEQAAEAHGWIRERLDAAHAKRARILYGGSVTPANIDGFLAQPAVDGVLVGGQSLDGGAFASLVRAALARGKPPVSGRSRP